MSLTPVTFTAPSYWAPALINGDDSGLSDQECNEVEECVADLVSKHGNALVVDMTELGFCRCSDYSNLAGGMAEYTILA